jgi:hypothetical protein
VVVFLFLLFQTNDVKHVPWSERAAKMGHFVFKAIWWFWIYLCLVYAVCLMCRATELLAFLLSSYVVLSRLFLLRWAV